MFNNMYFFIGKMMGIQPFLRVSTSTAFRIPVKSQRHQFHRLFPQKSMTCPASLEYYHNVFQNPNAKNMFHIKKFDLFFKNPSKSYKKLLAPFLGGRERVQLN